MPSGKTHAAVELALGPVFGAAYYVVLQPDGGELAAFAGAYLFSSLWLSPDLDLPKNAARRRWGPLGFLWAPYSKVFKHRGLSHSLVWGPLTRLIYLGLVLAAVIAGLSYLGGLTLPPAERAEGVLEDRGLLRALGVGLYLPNVLHVLLDRWVSAVRPRPRSRPPRRAGARGR